MRTMNELTAVLPTLNTAEKLADSLAALHGNVAGVVIADGGSTDATRAIAEAAGGFFGFGSISDDEQKMLKRLEAAFD